MQTREPLYNRVYKDLLSQIYEGTLPYQGALPSLYALHCTYGVSDNCIRLALSQLRERGYISTARGRAAQVVFDINAPSRQREFPFACDKKNLYAFYDAIEILFPSLYTFAAFTCTQEQMNTLAGIVAALPVHGESCEHYIELNIQFNRTVFSTLKNQLIVHMVTTVMQNTILPATLLQRQSAFLQEEFQQAADAMRKVYSAMLQRDRHMTKQYWKLLIVITRDTAKKAVENCRDIPEKEEEKAGLQYANEFKYMLIAHDLYQRILEGEYGVGDYLPTIEQSRQTYHSGAVTVRRAYHVLDESGLTGTENGRGTRVAGLVPEDGSPFDAGAGSVNRISYLEALAFLRIVCGDLLRSGITPSSSIRKTLEGPLNPSHRYSTLILCKEMMRGAATPAIYTLYQAISRHLFWGVHRKATPGGRLSTSEKHRRCVEIADLLEQGHTDQAVRLMRGLLAQLAHIL